MPQDVPKNTKMKTGEIFEKKKKVIEEQFLETGKARETLHPFLRGTVY